MSCSAIAGTLASSATCAARCSAEQVAALLRFSAFATSCLLLQLLPFCSNHVCNFHEVCGPLLQAKYPNN